MQTVNPRLGLLFCLLMGVELMACKGTPSDTDTDSDTDMDTDTDTGTDTKLQPPNNVAPAASISSPTVGVVFDPGQIVEFVGLVADGNGLDDITQVSWTSSLDGQLANNGPATPDGSGVSRISAVLSSGAHNVTLRVNDAAGAFGEDSIMVSVVDAEVEPTVVISEPAVFAVYSVGQSIDLLASATDPQEASTTLSYTWTAVNTDDASTQTILQGNPDVDGLITGDWLAGTIGGYMLTLVVEDTDGNTAEAAVAIQVEL